MYPIKSNNSAANFTKIYRKRKPKEEREIPEICTKTTPAFSANGQMFGAEVEFVLTEKRESHMINIYIL